MSYLMRRVTSKVAAFLPVCASLTPVFCCKGYPRTLPYPTLVTLKVTLKTTHPLRRVSRVFFFLDNDESANAKRYVHGKASTRYFKATILV